MKTVLPIRSSVHAVGAALFDTGLRVREEYDELVLNQPGFGLRVNAIEKTGGCMLHCFISVTEQGFAPGSLGLFHEMASEGYPVVGVGACSGRISCEFTWFHPEGTDWRISAERCQALVDRVVGARVSGRRGTNLRRAA